MMHTNSIITILKIKETKLNTKIIETKMKKPSNELMNMKVFGMKLYNKILKSVCNTLWMMHLLKTSILITKTPLTTLKSMSKAVMNK